MSTLLTSELRKITFDGKVKEIERSAEKLTSNLNIHTIQIRRNTSMEPKISEITQLVQNSNTVLLVAKAETISRLVSIVEIAKKGLQDTNYSQYNKISSITEEKRRCADKEEVEGKGDNNNEYSVVQERVILSILLVLGKHIAPELCGDWNRQL